MLSLQALIRKTMAAEKFDSDALVSLYQNHPCNANSILTRLSDDSGGLDRPATAALLSTDECVDRTDQNHIGASTFVYELAEAASLNGNSKVLDLGCGLGGSARLIADRYRCRVDGIDISPRRIREGNELTRMVGLQDLVRLYCADFREFPVVGNDYTHLWGQSAWVHITDKPRVIKRWMQSLLPGGVVAMEDSFLKSHPVSDQAQKSFDRLASIWMAEIPELSCWYKVFEPEMGIALSEDRTESLIKHFSQLIRSAVDCGATSNKDEREAWELAVDLAQREILGYVRIVATAPS